MSRSFPECSANEEKCVCREPEHTSAISHLAAERAGFQFEERSRSGVVDPARDTIHFYRASGAFYSETGRWRYPSRVCRLHIW